MGFMDGFLRKKNIGKYGEGQVETRFSVGSCKLLAGNDGINKKRHNKSDFEVHGD